MKAPKAPIPLYLLPRDPELRAFFRRGSLDTGSSFAIPAPVKPSLTGGEAVAA